MTYEPQSSYPCQPRLLSGEDLGLCGSCLKHSLSRVLCFFAEAIARTATSSDAAPPLPHGGREGAIPASAEAKARRAVQSGAERNGETAAGLVF